MTFEHLSLTIDLKQYYHKNPDQKSPKLQENMTLLLDTNPQMVPRNQH